MLLTINMQQFRRKWKTYADNADIAETIIAAKGKFITDNPKRYTEYLLDFGIFYTVRPC